MQIKRIQVRKKKTREEAGEGTGKKVKLGQVKGDS